VIAAVAGLPLTTRTTPSPGATTSAMRGRCHQDDAAAYALRVAVKREDGPVLGGQHSL
jgi:hypothetical protein